MITPNQLRSIPVPGTYSGAPVSRNVLVSCAHAWMADNAVVTIDGTKYHKVLKRLHVEWDTGKGKPRQPDLMAYLIEPIPDDLPIPVVRPPKDLRTAKYYGINRHAEMFPIDFSLDNLGSMIGMAKNLVKPTQMAAIGHWMPIPRKGGKFFTNYDSGSRILADDGSGDLLFIATCTHATDGPYLPYWWEGILQTVDRLGGERPQAR
jgi:hypothetical protein